MPPSTEGDDAGGSEGGEGKGGGIMMFKGSDSKGYTGGMLGRVGIGMVYKRQLEHQQRIESLEAEVSELKKQRALDQATIAGLDAFQLNTVKELMRLQDYVKRK